MSELSGEERVRKILSENNLCVLATSSIDGKPEAATIEYAEDGEFNLFFETFPTYRKYANLKSNPRVSVVVTELPYTVQMDGIVEELFNDKFKKAKEIHKKKQGEGSGFYSDPVIKFFKFTPTWIRVLVDSKYPPKYEVIKV